MLFISAVSSFTSASEALDEVRENAREVGIVLMGAAELILDILLLDVEYLSAILSRNPELAVLHLDARTDGEQVGSERGNRRAAAALLHIFELVKHKARAGLFVQINGDLRYVLRAHALHHRASRKLL